MTVYSILRSTTEKCLWTLSDPEFWRTVYEHKCAIAAGICTAYGVYTFILKPRSMPPGPMGLPFVGAMMKMSSNIHLDYMRFSEQYDSDVISLYIGRKLTVVLNSPASIIEAFLKSEDFADRGPFGEVFGLQDQIITQTKYDHRWRRLKSFLMSSFRNHGFGTPKSEENICTQSDRIIQEIMKNQDDSFSNSELEEIFTKAAACILMKMIANQDYDFEDEELKDLVDKIKSYQKLFFQDASRYFFLSMLIPKWLLKPFIRDISKRCVQSASGLRDILQRHLEEHRETVDEMNPRDYLDDNIIEFLHEPGYTDRMITDTTIAFIPDATDTVASQLVWCLYYLCSNPEAQDEMAKEIGKECGGKCPGLKDRSKLVYCEAVILESLRMSSMTAIAGGHTCRKDVYFRNYWIPKGSKLQANLYAVHYNEKIFPEPDKFKPQRFIEDGSLVNTEYVMPFSVGRRKCVGEPLTRSELFIFLTSIIQRFKVVFEEGHRPGSLQPSGMFRKAPECRMNFISR